MPKIQDCHYDEVTHGLQEISLKVLSETHLTKLQEYEYEDWVNRLIRKRSNKPFSSGYTVATVSGITINRFQITVQT